MSDNHRRTSKLLSLVLRHDPGKLGLALDAQGYVPVETLLQALARSGNGINRQQLDELVATSDKQRFAFSGDGTKIRANQGHSLEVDLGHQPAVPPATLYHGTATRFLDSILEKGLVRGARQHVHLSVLLETAIAVGKRHGRPIVFELDAVRMHGDGFSFFVSDNGVWLTDHVPAQYLRVAT